MGLVQAKSVQYVEKQHQIHPTVKQEEAVRKELLRVIMKETGVTVYQEVTLTIMTAFMDIARKGQDQVRKGDCPEGRKQHIASQMTVKASQITGKDIQHLPMDILETTTENRDLIQVEIKIQPMDNQETEVDTLV